MNCLSCVCSKNSDKNIDDNKIIVSEEEEKKPKKLEHRNINTILD